MYRPLFYTSLAHYLRRLRNVRDEDTVGPDGTTILARLQGLIQQVAEDIKTCANACDTYSKTKLLVKVLRSVSWEHKLEDCIATLSERGEQLNSVLITHIGVGMDDIACKAGADSLHTKMQLVLEFFAKAVSPGQLELTALVQKWGGAIAVLENDEALQELMQTKIAATTFAKRSERNGVEMQSRMTGGDLVQIKEELYNTPDASIRKNLELFERKLRMQQRELAEELQQMMMQRASDRVIDDVTSDPHDRILDKVRVLPPPMSDIHLTCICQDIHAIWTAMVFSKSDSAGSRC